MLHPVMSNMISLHVSEHLIEAKNRQTNIQVYDKERSGSVVECLTQDREAAGSSLTGVTALWSLSKTHLS